MSKVVSPRRIGIFGGTFDPIHIGHLLIAEQAREFLSLDEIRFVPAAISPLKTESSPRADAKQRLEMVQLAIGGNTYFQVDDRELTRGGASYTVETLRELHEELPDADLVFIMGADSLSDFDRWREPQTICELAFVAVLARGGVAPPDLDILRKYLPDSTQSNIDAHIVPTPQIEISSSDLRARIAGGRTVRYQLHPAVAAFVTANDLYLTPEQARNQQMLPSR